MTVEQVQEIVNNIKLEGPYDDKWFHVSDMADFTDSPAQATGIPYIQVQYMEPDIYTGEPALQRARVWPVIPGSSESQVVQICFGAALASAEHQVREFFTYEGARVFGPHNLVRDLMSVAQ